MVETTRFPTGMDIDTDDIPNYLRELADAVESDDVYINSVEDRKRASADAPVEREHRIAYSTTGTGIDLFNTRLVTVLDDHWEAVEDDDE